MRRKDREKNELFAYTVFDQCRYAILSTVNADGTPYCVPISPARKDDVIYFHCALAGQKLENMKNNPSVCLAFVGKTHIPEGQFTIDYESGIVFGTAQMIEDQEEKIEALRLICEKYTPDNMPDFDNEIQKSLRRTGICRIDVKKITGKKK